MRSKGEPGQGHSEMIWSEVRVQGCVYERGGGCGRADIRRAPSASLAQGGPDHSWPHTLCTQVKCPPHPHQTSTTSPGDCFRPERFSSSRLIWIYSDSIQNSGLRSRLAMQKQQFQPEIIIKKRMKRRSMVLHRSTVSWPTNISCLLTESLKSLSVWAPSLQKCGKAGWD